MSKECANCGNERIMLCPFCEHDYTDQSTLTTLRAQLAEAERWKKAITDAAVVNWTLTAENEKNPVEAINALLCDAQRIALDPRVCEEAAKLRDTYKNQLSEAERQIKETEKARKLACKVIVDISVQLSARDKTIGELREECRAWRAWCKDIRSDLERVLRRETISADTSCLRRVEAACAAVDASGAMGGAQE